MKTRKRTLPSGNTVWVVDYKDASGKRRAPQYDTRGEADKAAAKITAELEAGIHAPRAASITIAEAGEVWLAHIERRKREETTLRQYRQHLDKHIVPKLGRVKLADLSTPMATASMSARASPRKPSCKC
ncbi:MAG TPA: hypothetical protein VGR70_08730 [Stellaceae bacterium]|nr:hypothetical protein [Stellaceae bacterium]